MYSGFQLGRSKLLGRSLYKYICDVGGSDNPSQTFSLRGHIFNALGVEEGTVVRFWRKGSVGESDIAHFGELVCLGTRMEQGLPRYDFCFVMGPDYDTMRGQFKMIEYEVEPPGEIIRKNETKALPLDDPRRARFVKKKHKTA
jgi:hypothetical protein